MRWGSTTGVLCAVGVVFAIGGCSSPSTSAPAPIVGLVTCAGDAECDNGLPCDGFEHCEEGYCILGAAVNCNDNIGCTTDVCSNELGGECLHLPRDADFDGHADDTCADDSGAPLGDDCDDHDGNRYPGNVELCDAEGHDEDCDGLTIGVDQDGDGYVAARCCNGAVCGNDCDDLRPFVHPLGQELCDGLDNNCNGVKDEGLTVTMYQDLDGDQHGNPAVPLQLCAQSAHAAPNGDDCDDNDITIHPAQVEICDGKNNDCDGATDEDTPQVVPWYPDADGDNFGDPDGTVVYSCTPPADHALNDRDCNDDAPAISPVAAELCDGLDNDCNGVADYEIAVNDFEDDDSDRLVDGQCVGGTDCDDDAAETGPGSLELCDGRDNDCDDSVDEHASNSLWFRDLDSDGVGSTLSGVRVSCEFQAGYSQEGGDCDDADDQVYPGQFEICDGDDQNCDGVADEGIDFDSPAHCGSCAINCNQVAHSDNTCTSGRCNCDVDYDDCNDQAADGCEASLQDSWLHCGACGHSCAVEHGLAECVNGACEVVACVDEFGDCDGEGDNGCEQTTNVLTRCGDCTTNCNATVQNATGKSCDDQSCNYAACSSASFGDCDNDRTNGCEQALDNVSSHCGACGVRCEDLPHTTGTCLSGDCVCVLLHGDCDGLAQTGCEADFRDVKTCGDSCGALVDCTGPNLHGTPLCNNGLCEVICNDNAKNCDGDAACETVLGTTSDCGDCDESCVPPGEANGLPLCILDAPGDYHCATLCEFGWFSCDAEPRDCETNIATDEQNCGGCLVPCAVGESCIAGACQNNGGSGEGGTPLLAIDVAVGEDFTCAATADDKIYCWGNNDRMQLGDGNVASGGPEPGEVDLAMFNMLAIDGVYAGAHHACFSTLNGINRSLYCWGENQIGESGKDSAFFPTVDRPDASQAVTDIRLTGEGVALGANHSCVIDGAERVRCWGTNADNQLGRGAIPGVPFNPTIVAGTNLQIAALPIAGSNFSCALDVSNGQSAFCWGSNFDGQLTTLGAGFETHQTEPVLAGSFSTVNSWGAGSKHGCAASTSNIVCWGNNAEGQVVPGFPGGPELSPIGFIGPAPVIVVRAYAEHSCALYQTGAVECWGRNDAGQLGRFGDTQTPGDRAPVTFDPGVTIAKLARSSAKARHTCAIDDENQIWCWGENADGQLGTAAMPPGYITQPRLIRLP